MNTLIGTKQKMSQVFTLDGVRLPVTIVTAAPQLVTDVKTKEKDGYLAVQFGFGTRRLKTIKKPGLGHLKRALKQEEGEKKEQKEGPRFLREVRLEKEESFEIGTWISPEEILEVGDLVKVVGISKGKGFAGGVKRWGFAGGPKTHGQSDRHRAPGSIGQGTTPGRVYKGKHMAGRMGTDQNTVKNLVVLDINKEAGEIKLSGPVPGSRGTLLKITKIGKSKKTYDLTTNKVSSEETEVVATNQ
jgi:large subunit ribosomal protein L3